jgi:hypothetical protein
LCFGGGSLSGYSFGESSRPEFSGVNQERYAALIGLASIDLQEV